MVILNYDEIDELGDELIHQYLGADADNCFCVDIEGFVTEFLGLPLLYRTIAEKDTDKIGFISDGITPVLVRENNIIVSTVFPKGTIVIEKCLRIETESGKRRFTIAHEGAHLVVERALPQVSFHREFDSERRYTAKDFNSLFNLNETIVDRMGAALLMPRFMVYNVLKNYHVKEGVPVFGDCVLRAEDKLLIHDMANTMGATYTAFFIRLRELKLLKRHDLSEYISQDMRLGQDGDRR